MLSLLPLLTWMKSMILKLMESILRRDPWKFDMNSDGAHMMASSLLSWPSLKPSLTISRPSLIPIAPWNQESKILSLLERP